MKTSKMKAAPRKVHEVYTLPSSARSHCKVINKEEFTENIIDYHSPSQLKNIYSESNMSSNL
jgi:hypothetical protein